MLKIKCFSKIKGVVLRFHYKEMQLAVFLQNFGAEKVFIDFLILLQREFIMRL